jgi:hypothetical protein
VADLCRCHLPLDPPPDNHWLPWRDPEPESSVLAVALHGQHPTFLRRMRVPDGWHTEGSGANHPDSTPPRPWVEIGQCWAGEQHAVVDVTAFIAPKLEQSRIVVPIADVPLPSLQRNGHGRL